MRLVEEKHIKKLQDVYDFIEAFVDYYDGDPEVYEGEPTDAARMKQCLPAIKGILKSKRHVEKKARRAGKHHLKGPHKRTDEDDRQFADSFHKLIQSSLDQSAEKDS
jgi:hypothetical protein